MYKNFLAAHRKAKKPFASAGKQRVSKHPLPEYDSIGMRQTRLSLYHWGGKKRRYTAREKLPWSLPETRFRTFSQNLSWCD